MPPPESSLASSPLALFALLLSSALFFVPITVAEQGTCASLSSDTPPQEALSTSRKLVMAPLAVGEKLPAGHVWVFDSAGSKTKVSVQDWAKGKKVILFGVPGAFTPTCSLKHLPGFIEKAEELKKYVSDIACLSVNDPFVMKEWGKGYEGISGKVELFADGDGSYTKALGFDVDLSEHGLGVRSRRFSLLADDLIVKVLHLEEGGAFESSSADALLKDLAA